MGKGGGSGSSVQQASVPPELSPLYKQTGQNVQALQNEDPLSAYTTPHPTQVAGLSAPQQGAIDLTNMNLREATRPLEDSEIVNAGHRYFQGAIAPGIENRAATSGLGRSTALTNALAATEAQTSLPLLQGEQARRDALVNQALQVGDVQRGVEQAGYNTQAQDFLRRQAIAEQGVFGPLGQLPSTFGQTTTSKTSGGGGGMFK